MNPRLTLTPFDPQIAELLASLRAPQPLLAFGRYALIQRHEIASSPLAVATVACALGFVLGAALTASVMSSRSSKKAAEKKAYTAAVVVPATTKAASVVAAAATAAAAPSVSLLAAAAPSPDKKLESLLRQAESSRDAAEREATALREKIASLESKLAASQRTRKAVAAELAAAFGLPPTPTPASAPPKSYTAANADVGPSPASRFFATPPPPASEGRASRVAKALAAA